MPRLVYRVITYVHPAPTAHPPSGTTYLEVNIWVLANDRGAVALRRMPFP